MTVPRCASLRSLRILGQAHKRDFLIHVHDDSLVCDGGPLPQLAGRSHDSHPSLLSPTPAAAPDSRSQALVILAARPAPTELVVPTARRLEDAEEPDRAATAPAADALGPTHVLDASCVGGTRDQRSALQSEPRARPGALLPRVPAVLVQRAFHVALHTPSRTQSQEAKRNARSDGRSTTRQKQSPRNEHRPERTKYFLLPEHTCQQRT